jgi:hypothetical protein
VSEATAGVVTVVTALAATHTDGLAELAAELRGVQVSSRWWCGSHGRWKRPCLQTAHMTI